MATEFEYDGFHLGQEVQDVVDGLTGVIIGIAVYEYEAASALIQERRPEHKGTWRSLARLRPAPEKRTGLLRR